MRKFLSFSHFLKLMFLPVFVGLFLVLAGSGNAKNLLIMQDLNVRVVDGDTLQIVGSKQRIRLFGIDACEKGQIAKTETGKKIECGDPAHEALLNWSKGQNVRCQVRDVDIYDRLLAQCGSNSVPDFGAELVKQGLAVAYRYRSKVVWRPYEQMEKQARKLKKGLWAWQFDEPWIHRQKQKK